MEQVVNQIDELVKWLKDKAAEAGAKGLVVGVSGGIDSAVVSALIKRAFPEDSLGLIMPCSSCSDDARDAMAVVEAVGLKCFEFELTQPKELIFGSAVEKLHQVGYTQLQERLADANLRARLRMATLYTVANALNYLVVGTDNAAETYTGYFTKYGDGGVDILPITEFSKREVRSMAKALGIPQQIIDKAPSAGLWSGQTDETEMGVTYDHIDDLLEGKQIPPEAEARIEELHRRSEHKRQLPPGFPRTDK